MHDGSGVQNKVKMEWENIESESLEVGHRSHGDL
jgi:hypothetical protein